MLWTCLGVKRGRLNALANWPRKEYTHHQNTFRCIQRKSMHLRVSCGCNEEIKKNEKACEVTTSQSSHVPTPPHCRHRVFVWDQKVGVIKRANFRLNPFRDFEIEPHWLDASLLQQCTHYPATLWYINIFMSK